MGVSVVRASGAATPTGTVTVSDGTVTSPACALSGSGGTATATCTLTPTTKGAKTLTATYGGDSAFNGSSGTTAHTVDGIGTTTTITSDTPDPSARRGAISVGVSVVRASGAATPTGTVTVSDGTVTSPACALSGSGGTATATCTLTPTTAGAKTLTATYGGDTTFLTSTSAGVAHSVTGADGTGTMVIHTAVVGTGTYSVFPITPNLQMELLDYEFTAGATAFGAGSQVTLVIPAGWTAPTLTAGSGGTPQVWGALRSPRAPARRPPPGPAP